MGTTGIIVAGVIVVVLGFFVYFKKSRKRGKF